MSSERPTLADRFARFVSVDGETGCWLWQGCLTTQGYGGINEGGRRGRLLLAHRVSWEMHRGPVPDGMHLDHLCRVRRCCNPDHLEPVTPRENVRRGEMVKARIERNAAQTHCKNGHALTPNNLDPSKLRGGKRQCLICLRASQARYRTRTTIAGGNVG